MSEDIHYERVPLVYTAGPFRGPTAWDIAENVRAMERIALEVAKLGAMPLCPHANTQHFQGQCNDNFWINGTLELLRVCPAAIFHPNWKQSAGSRGERGHAGMWGIEIFDYPDGLDKLAKWIEEWKATDPKDRPL
jgi:hypothetical protein